MPRLKNANNARTTLLTDINEQTTSFTVASASAFTDPPFRVTIGDEIMEVRAKDGNIFSDVLRGLEGKPAVPHNAGEYVENRWTAGMHAELLDRTDTFMIDAEETPVGDEGTIGDIASWIANRISKIKGKDWKDDPDLSLSLVNAQVQAMREPNGFPNRTDSTFSFDDVTREFTIEPIGESYDIFFRGEKITKFSAETVILPNLTGAYFIFFDSDGVLSYSNTIPSLDEMVYICNIWYNADQGKAIVVGDERHGTVMDSATHMRMHLVDGAQYVSGLQLHDYALDDDTELQVSLTDGLCMDEDLRHFISHSDAPSNFYEQVLTPAELPVIYREGTDWVKDIATVYPFKNTENGRVNFNSYDNGWGQSEVSDGGFVAYWLIFTNDVRQPIKVVQGQREDTTLEDAKANNDDRNISWGTMPFQEFKVLYRLVIQSSNSFSGPRKAKLVDVLDLRADKRARGSTFVPSAHSTLTGLDYASSGHVGFASGQELLRVEYAELSSYASNQDEDSIYTKVEWRRKDDTIYAVSTLLGIPPYSQVKLDYYDEDGLQIIKAITWNLEYDNQGFPYERVIV